jgi:hypothetical protein
MPLLRPDAKLFDESAHEVILESYLGQDVMTFGDDKTYEFHQAVERTSNDKLAGHRVSLVLFCNQNGVAAVLHNPKQLARFLRDESRWEIVSELFPGCSAIDYFRKDEEQHLQKLVDERVAGKLAQTLPSKVLDNLHRWGKEGTPRREFCC